jgi:flagellar basal-body rod protein FlgC
MSSLNQSFDISVSAINAERLHMELISSNIANANTTRTITGEPYRRRIAVMSEKPLRSFAEELAYARLKLEGGGVEVTEVVEDQTPFQRVFNPGHPDADSQGYVNMPNVDLAREMVDMVYASKLYEANITAFNATKKMMQDTLQIQ